YFKDTVKSLAKYFKVNTNILCSLNIPK
ncbi:unnamed protein product, partial [Brassicogethes aeneus]